LAFQVDLWSARGRVPLNLGDVVMRQKEIQYSSRTRASSDQFKKEQRLRNALADLFAQLPDELRKTPEFALLHPEAGRKVYNIIQLIYRSKQYEGESKDFEFSSASMEDHWAAGRNDTVRTLRHPEVLERPDGAVGVSTFDLAAQGRM
jgi:NTE family protein